MGWWGYGVMEGDTPLDCEGDINDFLADPLLVEVREAATDDSYDNLHNAVYESGYEALKTEANVRTAYHAIWTGELCSYNPEIATQVLAEMIMVSGGFMPTELRESVYEVTNNMMLEDGGWRDEDARVEELKKFITRVEAYEGVALEPTCHGLLDTMMFKDEAAPDMEGGLINV